MGDDKKRMGEAEQRDNCWGLGQRAHFSCSLSASCLNKKAKRRDSRLKPSQPARSRGGGGAEKKKRMPSGLRRGRREAAVVEAVAYL